MAKTAEDYEGTYTEPELREQLKEEIKDSDKGGKPGQWSARKSQLLTQAYESEGGGYVDDERTEAQQSLEDWTEEDWQTSSGSVEAREEGPGDTVARYLPRKAWELLSEEDREATEALKLDGTEQGEQHVGNTDAAKRARRLGKVLAHYEDDSIDDLRDRLGGMSTDELRVVLAVERDRKDRKGGKEALESAIRKAQERDGK